MITKKEKKTAVEAVAEEPKKSSLPPVSQKSFLEIEEPELYIDILRVDNWPANYAQKWCKKEKMPNFRLGNWVAVDKNHPDFKGIKPVIDHTPKESYVTNGDLILCCMRKETHEKLWDLREERNRRVSEKAEESYKSDIDRLRSNLKRKGDLRVIE